MTDTIDQDIELLGGVQAGMTSKGFDRVWRVMRNCACSTFTMSWRLGGIEAGGSAYDGLTRLKRKRPAVRAVPSRGRHSGEFGVTPEAWSIIATGIVVLIAIATSNRPCGEIGQIRAGMEELKRTH